MQLKKLSGRKL